MKKHSEFIARLRELEFASEEIVESEELCTVNFPVNWRTPCCEALLDEKVCCKCRTSYPSTYRFITLRRAFPSYCGKSAEQRS